MGSGELIASLMAAGLIDEFLLMIHPLVLGRGRRLFRGRGRPLAATGGTAVASLGGVVIATYEPAPD